MTLLELRDLAKKYASNTILHTELPQFIDDIWREISVTQGYDVENDADSAQPTSQAQFIVELEKKYKDFINNRGHSEEDQRFRQLKLLMQEALEDPDVLIEYKRIKTGQAQPVAPAIGLMDPLVKWAEIVDVANLNNTFAPGTPFHAARQAFIDLPDAVDRDAVVALNQATVQERITALQATQPALAAAIDAAIDKGFKTWPATKWTEIVNVANLNNTFPPNTPFHVARQAFIELPNDVARQAVVALNQATVQERITALQATQPALATALVSAFRVLPSEYYTNGQITGYNDAFNALEKSEKFLIEKDKDKIPDEPSEKSNESEKWFKPTATANEALKGFVKDYLPNDKSKKGNLSKMFDSNAEVSNAHQQLSGAAAVNTAHLATLIGHLSLMKHKNDVERFTLRKEDDKRIEMGKRAWGRDWKGQKRVNLAFEKLQKLSKVNENVRKEIQQAANNNVQLAEAIQLKFENEFAQYDRKFHRQASMNFYGKGADHNDVTPKGSAARMRYALNNAVTGENGVAKGDTRHQLTTLLTEYAKFAKDGKGDGDFGRFRDSEYRTVLANTLKTFEPMMNEVTHAQFLATQIQVDLMRYAKGGSTFHKPVSEDRQKWAKNVIAHLDGIKARINNGAADQLTPKAAIKEMALFLSEQSSLVDREDATYAFGYGFHKTFGTQNFKRELDHGIDQLKPYLTDADKKEVRTEKFYADKKIHDGMRPLPSVLDAMKK